MDRARLVLLAIAGVALMACADDDRPPGEEGAEQSAWTSADDLTLDPGATEIAPSPSAPKGDPCVHGDARECRLVYYDAYGHKHCPMATQFCRADGAGWLACGALPDPPPLR